MRRVSEGEMTKDDRVQKMFDKVSASSIEVAKTFVPEKAWRAGSIQGPSGGLRMVEADGLAEDMLVQAVVQCAADSKVVNELLARTTAVLYKYIRSPSFEKRIQAHVEACLGALLAEDDILGFAKNGTTGVEIRSAYVARMKERWQDRVEEEVERDLAAAVAEVRSKFVGGGG